MAAQVVGLDIAGIDFICPDIATPVRESGGAIVEVNAAPGLPDAHQPDRGRAAVRGAAGDRRALPAGLRRPDPDHRGDRHQRQDDDRPDDRPHHEAQGPAGRPDVHGRHRDRRAPDQEGRHVGPQSAQMVLQNPTVDTAVFEVARGGILREGLGYDRNDVAVVTNVTGDHLGLGGIDSLGQLANVKAVIVEAVPRSGTAVLNADDPLVARMARHCAGRVVYFSMATEKGEDGYDRVDGHVGRGGAAFCLQNTRRGRARRAPARGTPDAGALHAPDPGDVRRPGADERRERAGRGGRSVGRRRAPARHPAGPAHLLDLVLPGAGPAEHGRPRRHPRRHRLLPQRGRHAQARRLRGADDGRRPDAQGEPEGCRRTSATTGCGRGLDAAPTATQRAWTWAAAGQRPRRRPRAGWPAVPDPRAAVARWASSASRATGATRTSASTERSPRRRSTRSSSARTRTCGAVPPGESATNVVAGANASRASGRGRSRRNEKILEELAAVRSMLRRATAGDLVVLCVDDPVAVYREAMASRRRHSSGSAFHDPGELSAPTG